MRTSPPRRSVRPRRPSPVLPKTELPYVCELKGNPSASNNSSSHPSVTTRPRAFSLNPVSESQTNAIASRLVNNIRRFSCTEAARAHQAHQGNSTSVAGITPASTQNGQGGAADEVAATVGRAVLGAINLATPLSKLEVQLRVNRQSEMNCPTTRSKKAVSYRASSKLCSIVGSGSVDQAIAMNQMNCQCGELSVEHTTSSGSLPMIVEYAAVSQRGSLLKKNQDCGLICHNEEPNGSSTTLFGVCDGHGPQGHEASHAAVRVFANMSMQPNPSPMIDMVYAAEDLLASQPQVSTMSGTTCCMVQLTGGELVCSNVGDSRAIFIPVASEEELFSELFPSLRSDLDSQPFVELSVDHNVANEDEINMLADKGVAIEHGRVWATAEDGEKLIGFNLTRSLGDMLGKKLVLTATPEQQRMRLEDHGDHGVLLVASDGLWEFMDSSVVAHIVQCNEKQGLELVCQRLVCKARSYWLKEGENGDDITVVAARIGPRPTPTTCV